MGEGFLSAPNMKQLTMFLSSGGVHGVLELRILREILRQVGHDIPVQELFDLAVGTSTGIVVKFMNLQCSAYTLRRYHLFSALQDGLERRL